MRFIHLSDLHLGRSLCDFSLLEVQRAFLQDVLHYVDQHPVDAVLLCGDIYDRTSPPASAVLLLNEFLTGLCARKVPVLIIAGNHDSPERLAFLSDLLRSNQVYIAGNYRLGEPPVTLHDQYGPVHFYLLPFFRPGAIRSQLPEEKIDSYDDAVRLAVEHMPLNPLERNVLLAHQFVSIQEQPALRSESEMLFAGGTEQVDARHFDAFDYVALGHLHRAQKAGREAVRYAGTPLHYALGEADDQKSFPVVWLGPKGEVSWELVPVSPLRRLTTLKGTLQELLDAPCDRPDDFFVVTLTDKEAVYDAMQRLRVCYPNVLSVHMERDQASIGRVSALHSASSTLSPLELFEQFFEEHVQRPLSQGEREEVLLALQESEQEAEI